MRKSRVPLPARTILRDPVHFLAFGFGTGLSPIAPGTCGTLAALPLYAIISQLHPTAYLFLVGFLLCAGVIIAGRSSAKLGIADPSGIVIDEIAGYLLTLTGAPVTWPAVILGFILFRLFDVWKPWPIRLVDRCVHGGVGIMLDDAVAGLFAALSLKLLLPWVDRWLT